VLEGFTESTFTHDGKTHPVFRRGTGPGVVVIHEIPGITPLVAEFGRRVGDAGFTAVLPSLFGEPGKPMGLPYVFKSFTQVCISREFTTWALRSTSPVIEWVRALARQAHEECGGPGVGAVGMCATGGFALAMAVDDELLAPVLSQPSFPLAIGKRAGDLGLSDADLARVKERVRDDGLCIMGLRFAGDRVVPRRRFEALERELGEGFIGIEIPGKGHSVLTEDLVDEPGHPTLDALDRVIDFFRERLLKPQP
jgi:dienelactone hydrolase